MRYQVRKNIVRVVGHIWQPGVGLCAYDYTPGAILEDEDAQRPVAGDFYGDPTDREEWEQWIARNSGDFQSIEDFEVDLSLEDGRDILIPWASEESECTYSDAMFGDEG